MNVNPALQAQEVLITIRAVRGSNYAEVVKHHANLTIMQYLVKDRANNLTRFERMALSTAKALLTDLTAMYGINPTTPDFNADLRSILTLLGVKK